jgi:hypothetical protein
MTIDFYFARIQQQDPDNWKIVAEFAAQVNGFMLKEFTGAGDFLLHLNHLGQAVEEMISVAEELK